MFSALVRSYYIVWPPLPVATKLNAFVIVIAIYTAGVTAFLKIPDWHIQEWSSFSAALNAILLGVLLQFRNKESYDRWWEGRKLWGQLVNDSRNLALKVRHLPGIAPDDRARIGSTIVGFAISLRNHLRGGAPLQAIPGFEKVDAEPTHVPMYFTGELMSTLQGWRKSGRITEVDLLVLDPHVRAWMDVCGACERIRSTPLPTSYRSLLRHGLVLYMLSTPWLVVEQLGWVAPGVMALVAYFLLGIEMTAADVEEPFGRDGDDLSLSKYCETIRNGVAQALSLPTLPDTRSLAYTGTPILPPKP